MSGGKMRAPTSPSNVFQILGNIQKQQQAVQSQSKNQELVSPFRTTTPFENSAPTTDSQAGKSSTCTCTAHAKYFIEWTSSTRCTYPQAATAGSETCRLISLKESPSPPQQQDFCEQAPIDKTADSVTLLQLL